MPPNNPNPPLPLASAGNAAALFAIERAGTLLFLVTMVIFGPSASALFEQIAGPAGSAWLILLSSAMGAFLMRLSLPLWCRLLLRVRLLPGYFRHAWPQWTFSLWGPLFALSFALGNRARLAASLFLWLIGLLAPRLSNWRLLHRLDRSAVPLMLPPPAVELLNLSGLCARQVHLDQSTPDLIAWTPSTGPHAIILGPAAIEKLTPEELTAVIAHELGHVRLHRHVFQLGWQALALTAATAFVLFLPAAAFGLAFPPAATTVPAAFLAAALLESLAIPLTAARGRRQELAANAWALSHLPGVGVGPDAFASMLRNVHELLGRPPQPPRWYHVLFNDYPSLEEALAHACRAAKQ
jgi:Zn-dependent protease with chaperone function